MPDTNLPVAAPPASGADLLGLLRQAGGQLRLANPPKKMRAAWRRSIHALINGGELPPGMCIRYSGRDQGDLIIRLVPVEESPPAPPPAPTIPIPTTLRDCHPMIRATREAMASKRGGVDNRRTSGLLHLRIHKSSLGRSLLIVQGLIDEAERRGYHVAPHKSYGCDGGLGIVINGHSFEVTVKEEQRQIDHVLTTSEQRDKERGYFYGRRFDAEWTGRLQLREGHETFTAPLATDRKRWRLEDRLPQALLKLEAMTAAAEERRQAEERRRLQQQRDWEVAMEKAKGQFAERFRTEWLDEQIAAWRKTVEIREFVAHARAVASSEEDQSWLDWAETYASEIDRVGRPLAPEHSPKPEPEDLAPFLGGLSPYGPGSSARW